MDIQEIINGLDGIFIEIAGPSPEGYAFLEELKITIPKKVIITNISNPITLNPYGDNPATFEVDQVADIRNLPYSAGEISLIMTSSLPHVLHQDFFINSKKALHKGGLIIIENELDEDKKLANELGFAPILNKAIAEKYYSQIYLLK